ncbi:hypothetical protein AN958_04503 [Leucoagaricus sp. SymC.cos]|nr:hypothetical protein AN958_04503 [Leucoagaricus sp. SymC.cos]
MSSKRFQQQPSGGPASPHGSSQSSTSTFNVSASLASASASTHNLINSTSHLHSNISIQNAPLIKHLHQVLWQASGSSSSSLRSVYLPHEALVLSALLVPFASILSVDANNATVSGRLEEERWLAIDAFDLAVKTWPPRERAG